MWLAIGSALLVACERPPEKGDAPKPPAVANALGKVEEILTGDPPAVDPATTDPVPAEPVKPAVPVAKPVPDKPGFVISPYNGKWIDVTGVAPGELMLDPHFPAEEKKLFRVPEPVKPTPAEPPPATGDAVAVEAVSPPVPQE
jgi:hypothetical protein